MAVPQVTLPTLTTGDRLSREEFLRIWDGLPSLKNAELIDGVVYVASPVSRSHWSLDKRIIWFLTHYEFATPGCEAGNNGTWLMLESAPQPDSFLRLLPSHGGQSSDDNLRFPTGAPELAVEVTVSTSDVDFGRKLALYQRAGVREYVTIEELFSRITWRSMQPDGSYTTIEPDTNDIIRSRVFPGLWLNRKAFWADDGKAMLSTLEAGLASPEHTEFVRRLA